MPNLPNLMDVLAHVPSSTDVLLFGGSADCQWPSQGNAVPLYANVAPNVCKAYVEVQGGSSCAYPTELPLPYPRPPGVQSCFEAEAVCGAQPTVLSRSAQQSVLFVPLVTSWLSFAAAANSSAFLTFRARTMPATAHWPVPGMRPLSVYMDCNRTGTHFTGVRQWE